MPLEDKMHSQRNFVLNIGFGRSPTSIFEVGFVKLDSKNCEFVPTCPACYDCKCKNFLNRKITVRFKLNLKMDGLNCKMIFKSGERIERLHSCSKQCFRLYKNTFCVAKCVLGNPKPLNCTVPEQAVRLYHFVKQECVFDNEEICGQQQIAWL